MNGRKQDAMFWPTEAAYALDGRRSPQQVIADLAAEFRQMPPEDIADWPNAQALIDLADRQAV